jgi:hypothetical protein
MNKKLLALTIIFMLAFISAGCKNGGTSQTKSENPNDAANDLVFAESFETGDIIKLDEISWLVLDMQGDKALLISESILENMAYQLDGSGVTWEDSTIRQYLSTDFYNNLSASMRARILETEVINNDSAAGTPGGNTTYDKIFLLSMDELNKYFSDDAARVAYTLSGADGWWWLRSPGLISTYATRVYYGGQASDIGGSVEVFGGMRPAFWISLQ